jgi:hypothetical protein
VQEHHAANGTASPRRSAPHRGATVPTSSSTTTATSSASRPVTGTARRPLPRPRLPRTPDEVFAASTVVLAVGALLLTVLERYDLGAVVALAAVLVGGSSQLLSVTRFERWESVCATVLAAVLLAVCLANGSGVFTTTAVLDA